MQRLLADVWDGLRSRPLRSALAVTSLGVGMLSLTLLLAVLDAFAARAEAVVQLLGVDAFAIVAERAANDSVEHLELDHAVLLAANLPGARVAHARYDETQSPGVDRRVTVVAADAALAEIKGWRAAEGRLLDVYDELSRARNAVISHGLQVRTGWRPGQVVRFGEQAFTVVGVLAAHAAAFDTLAAHPALSGGTELVIVPYTLVPDWLSGFALQPGTQIDALFVKLGDDEAIAQAAAIARRVLIQPDLSAGAFSIVTPDTLTAGITALRESIYATIGAVAVLALALGGTTLMSLMLANVRERVVEIGLRRALGATVHDIVALFVSEALLLTAAAACAGIVTAALLLDIVAGVLGTPLALGAAPLLLPVATGVLLALAFSYWPARLAASIQPATALRAA